MAAGLSWIDHCQLDLDGALSLGGTATTVHTIDPAYPGTNVLAADPSLVTRVNYTRNATAAADMLATLQWSTTVTDKRCRVIVARNMRLPANVVQVTARVMTHAGVLVEQAPQTYLAADLVPVPGTTDRYHLIFVLSVDRLAARVDLMIRVAASTSGYYEIGRLWCGPALLLPMGVDRGWKLLPVDPSEVERARGGALIAQQLPKRSRLTAPISVADYATAMGNPADPTAPSLRSMGLECGRGTHMIVFHRSTSLHSLQVLGLYCSIAELQPVSNQDGDYYETSIEAEEVR